MKLLAEYNALTIVGSWNYSIFTSEWISQYLLDGEKLKVQYPIGGNASQRITTDEMRLSASQGRFDFTILKHEDIVYLKIGELALKLADYLMHTPVSSFGLNFLYESMPTADLDSYFLINDSENLSANNLEAKTTQIKRSFETENNTLNFTVVNENGNYKFDFNYHFAINSFVDFKDKFEPKDLIKYKKESAGLLLELYDLEME